MKKIFLILTILFAYSISAQTLQNPTYGNTTTNTLKIKNPATVTSVNFLPAFDADGITLSKIDPVSLPFFTKSLYPKVTVVSNGNYNAFPSLEKLDNGTLLTVYRKGVDHLTFDGSIILKSSTDKGATWSSENPIIPNTSGHDYRDPGITKLANGNIILSYFDRISSSDIRIYTAISTNNGASFGTPLHLTGYDYGAVSSKAVQLINGNLLLATYGKIGSNGLLNVYRSTNNGASWTVLSSISTDAFVSALKYSEPNLVLLPNGDILASVRNDSNQKLAFSKSTDSGATWSTVTDVFDSNSRGSLGVINGKTIITYRTLAGNSALRYSADNGSTWSSEVLLTNVSIGEQDEYSSFVNDDKQNLYYVNSIQNSTATAANIYFRYINDPISLGSIPVIQTDGVVSKGVSTFETYINANNIKGISGDMLLETNTVSTTRGIVFKTGNTNRVKILGTGFVGFGTDTPSQVIDVAGNTNVSGFSSVPLVNTQQIRSNSSTGILKVVGGATNYGGSIDVIGTGFGSNNGGINFRTGLAVGESPIVASFNSSGLFNVVGNISASNYSGSATLTGTSTATTAPAGTNTTQIATTAFVQANARPYKVYTALLTQSGTSAPTATVLENSLGGTLVWTRNNSGNYSATLTGAFATASKVWLMVSYRAGTGAVEVSNVNTVGLLTADYTGTTIDGKLTNTAIEIRIYP